MISFVGVILFVFVTNRTDTSCKRKFVPVLDKSPFQKEAKHFFMELPPLKVYQFPFYIFYEISILVLYLLKQLQQKHNTTTLIFYNANESRQAIMTTKMKMTTEPI